MHADVDNDRLLGLKEIAQEFGLPARSDADIESQFRRRHARRHEMDERRVFFRILLKVQSIFPAGKSEVIGICRTRPAQGRGDLLTRNDGGLRHFSLAVGSNQLFRRFN